MIKNKIEFKVGDKVTYMPYSQEVAAIVKEVDIHSGLSSPEDERIFYRLGGNANAVTTGLCIKESIYFKPSQKKKSHFS